MVRHIGEATSALHCVLFSEKLRDRACFPLFYMLLRKTIFQQFSPVKKLQ